MPTLGLLELVILLVIMAVPLLMLLGLVVLVKGRHQEPASNNEELTQVLQGLNAGLARMEERMRAVEEVLGAKPANRN